MKRLRLLAAIVVVLLACGSAGASTGESVALHGRVLDENGLPVGGAQVKLEVAGGQIFSALTDEAGSFSLKIPPAEYTVRIEKVGFFVLAGEKVVLTLDATEFSFTLNHEQEVHEQVDVVANANRVEPTDTTQSATLTATHIRDIPVPSSHDLQQSLVALPQVVRDNSDLIHIAGARNTQEQYLLDGFEIGNPINNSLTAHLSVDALRSAEVQTGRFGAQYAHPGAAILSLNTPEGDDRWRFDAADFIPGITFQEGTHFGNWYPRFSLSGPFVKEKFWFYEGLSFQHSLTVVKGQPSGQNLVNQWSGDALTRLLWKVSSNHSLHGSFLYNKQSDANEGLDALHPISTTVDINTHRIFGSIKDQYWWNQTLLELGIAGDDGFAGTSPQGNAPYIQLVNGAQGNYFQDLQQEGERLQTFFNVTRAGLHWHGLHTLSGGANVSGVEFTQSATRGTIQAMLADGTTISRLTTFSGPSNFSLSDTLAGAYLQDAWTPNRWLILQGGIRTDWDRLLHVGMAEPSVSANVMPFKDNRGKLSVGWGIYAIPVNLSVVGQTSDQQQVDTIYNYDPNCTVNCTPISTTGPATSRFVLPTGGFQAPYFEIASVGWQQRVGASTIVDVELLARDQHHGLVFETQNPGEIGDTFVLRTSRRDKYRGITFSARRQFENGTELFGAYTRSRASSDQVLDPTLGALYFAPQQSSALAWDAPNRVISWGSVPTPLWGILFSYFFEFRSGYPFSAVNQQQFLIGVPNSYRFPDYANLTIGLEKKFRFTGYLFAARVSVINIMGRANPDVVVNNVDAPNFLAFNGGQGRALTARLRFLGRK